MDTTPLYPRQSERRLGPRREADRRLHYAREGLVAAALAVHDAEFGESVTMAWEALDVAVEQYRAADAAAHG